MQGDFHYYATYCAAYIAGYSHEEAMAICYCSQFTDHCSKTYLSKIGGPKSAATTMLQLEMMETILDVIGLQDITRIWSSFHFLPKDLYADSGCRSKRYTNKYRLICGPNGELLADTVQLAKGRDIQAAGLAMHILADTWAHSNFAGTPSFAINNTDYYFSEIIGDGEDEYEKPIEFVHNPKAPDDLENSKYTNSMYQPKEHTIMNLGHGRAGHLPDYSFIKFRYLPSWGKYKEIVKDNPSDYYKAFCQMVYALKYLKGSASEFALDTYAYEDVAKYEKEIKAIIKKRQLIASDDWKAFGESLSGEIIEDFAIEKYESEYVEADEDQKELTFLGRYFNAAMAQKSMVTNKIYNSGNFSAGLSIDYEKSGFKGIKDYKSLIQYAQSFLETQDKSAGKKVSSDE